MDEVSDRPGTLGKKLHSLSGVVPLGIFLVLHIAVTSSIAGSRESYDRRIGVLHDGLLMGLLEVVLVLAPLAYHAGYGITRVFGPRVERHAYENDLMFALQRASGVAVLVFVVAHLWELRVQTWTQGLAVSAYSSKLVMDLSWTSYGVPWIALGYLVGLAATVFHFVNGLSSSFTTWGVATAAGSKARARIAFRIVGALLFVTSAGVVVQLATGAHAVTGGLSPVDDLPCGTAAVMTAPPPRARATASGAQASPLPSSTARAASSVLGPGR